MNFSQNSILIGIQHINKYKWNSHCIIEDIPTIVKCSKRDTGVKNSLLDYVGEGEGGMSWQCSIETCILSYVKWIAGPSSMHETGYSGLVHWDDPGEWDKEGGGRGILDGEHMCAHGWFMLMYGKKHYNIVK